ncbi:ribosome assembly RNA-binding protein YhbY [Candidatus Mcinerneyibacteriota bacterium]|nr:ribosome assembly RNA-binding protein YhbY [Candidatus Mcinerneyibacteriota bacterium]
MLTPKQRKYLEKEAHEMTPTAFIGKNGMTATVVHAVIENIDKNELIKIKIQKDAPVEKREVAAELAEAAGAEVVRLIGGTIILFKPLKENSRFPLP